MSMIRVSAATLALLSATSLAQAQTSGYQRPYDPYPWCAVYGGRDGGASNCGFLTIEQCMATVSGIGGSCEPNQFYNPRHAGERARKRRPR
jgi:hypothetical protein